jgi:hypothetical protein
MMSERVLIILKLHAHVNGNSQIFEASSFSKCMMVPPLEAMHCRHKFRPVSKGKHTCTFASNKYSLNSDCAAETSSFRNLENMVHAQEVI